MSRIRIESGGKYLVVAVCVGAAAYLAAHGCDGWAWLMVLGAFLTW